MSTFIIYWLSLQHPWQLFKFMMKYFGCQLKNVQEVQGEDFFFQGTLAKILIYNYY